MKALVAEKADSRDALLAAWKKNPRCEYDQAEVGDVAQWKDLTIPWAMVVCPTKPVPCLAL